MAAHEKPLLTELPTSPSLIQQLESILPKAITFKIYHLSTPPTRTSAIYSAPPDSRPDRTYCESHFLTVSIQTPSKEHAVEFREVLVFAIEVLIYSTAYDSTFFVSKADSTGYLHLLNLPKGTPSPIKDISGTFLRHLLTTHQRPNIRSVVSLFARAQDQYLFPGSVEYSGKHVLDDRGLVKWWCRVLDPLIERTHSGEPDGSEWDTVNGYLIVPGLDTHETRSSLPKSKMASTTHWTVGHPLRQISRHFDDVPPRCLIPHFPDDPKARFLDELDEEISKGKQESNGQWKSVRSIDQFWEMMSFRQECSAGRLVGFIWIVFNPKFQHNPSESVVSDSQTTGTTVNSQMWDIDTSLSFEPGTPSTSFIASSQILPLSSPFKRVEETLLESSPIRSSKPSILKKKKKKLTGPIISRKPRVKTENKNYLLDRPESTAYYSWVPEGRGQVIVNEADYKRETELLLRLDFANLELANSSTKRWISEVRSVAWGSMRDAWGQSVTGTKIIKVRNDVATVGVTTLNVGLVKKKRKVETEASTESSALVENTPKVNVLTSGMIRKKPKT
ncbi:hypothetical protein B7494_g7696 [Chlorociboria aeruginascens]|nr:hypothetical protein B7494_g7696 [Chlorociboria aeruginascens]